MVYFTPRKSIVNAYGESFNGKFRDECLNIKIIDNLH
ncbi:MAG: integrase core domain-containing protein [Candidatus Xenobiia bacterium LiM19]